MMHIKRGSTRIAILFTGVGLAVKVPNIYRLFDGVYHNWSEFVFFYKTRHGFCQPTYFSLFGLLNVQKYGEHVKDDMEWGDIFWPHIAPLIIDLPRDRPHWSNGNNFTRVGKKLYLIDYGSRVTREILMMLRTHLEALEV